MLSTVSKPQIPEGVVQLTHALVEDATLRARFLALERLSSSRRRSAFRQMADEMSAAREDSELVAAVSALVRPALYAAVRDSVRERCAL